MRNFNVENLILELFILSILYLLVLMGLSFSISKIAVSMGDNPISTFAIKI